MILGIHTNSLHPLGGFGYLDSSILPLFEELFNNVQIERLFVARLYPYDPVGAAEIEIKLGGSVRHLTVAYPDRLIEALNIENRIEIRDGVSIGSANQSVGSVIIANGDAEYDDLTEYFWDGRKVAILVGADFFQESQFTQVFVGVADDVAFDHDTFSILTRDASLKMEVDIQPNLYLGDWTGAELTLEGSLDLRDSPKPLCFGECKNITPILVNPPLLVYQFHDGPVESVDDVFDKGIALTPVAGGNDITDLALADVFAWTPVLSEYITDIAQGLIRLGGKPVAGGGLITADVKGDNSDGTLGYVDSAARIVQVIVTLYGPLLEAELDLTSFSDLDTLQPAVHGIYIPIPGVSVLDAVEQLLSSILAFRTHDRDGLLRIGRIEDPSGETSLRTYTEGDIVDGTFQRLETGAPFHKVTISHSRNWTVQSDDTLVPGAGEDRIEFAKVEYRKSVDEDSAAVQAKHLLARTLDDETLFQVAADADTEATRRLGMFKVQRDSYSFSARDVQFLHEVGETITIAIPRFGLDAGKKFVITSVGENSSTQITTFEVWG